MEMSENVPDTEKLPAGVSLKILAWGIRENVLFQWFRLFEVICTSCREFGRLLLSSVGIEEALHRACFFSPSWPVLQFENHWFRGTEAGPPASVVESPITVTPITSRFFEEDP